MSQCHQRHQSSYRDQQILCITDHEKRNYTTTNSSQGPLNPSYAAANSGGHVNQGGNNEGGGVAEPTITTTIEAAMTKEAAAAALTMAGVPTVCTVCH